MPMDIRAELASLKKPEPASSSSSAESKVFTMNIYITMKHICKLYLQNLLFIIFILTIREICDNLYTQLFRFAFVQPG